MKNRVWHLAWSGVLGVGIGVLATTMLAAQQPPRVGIAGVDQKFLLNAPLAQFPGKRIDVFVGTFKPGARTPLHRHPGTELLYVLEGEGEMIIPGQPTRALSEGKIELVEPLEGEDSFVHLAANGSATSEMKTLVLVIHDEGTPMATPVAPEAR